MQARPNTQGLLQDGLQIREQLIAFRRDLHRYPELSFEESETAAKVAAELENLQLDAKTNVGGHGVVADLYGDRAGPTIALRADMDALPIQEETNLPFASERTGIMHACGHDAHTSILLGAAKLLVKHKNRLAGRVRFIFQSAEEIVAGAKAMIREGVLDGVDEIYGLHNLPSLASGKVATICGPMLASVDRLEIAIEGVGGHGAMPDRCRDPIVAAAAVITGLQTAVSREISPFDPVVVSIGSIHAGDANNVIPQRAVLTGTIRTFSSEVRKGMSAKLRRIAEGIAEAYGCQARVDYTEQVPVLANTAPCVAHVEDTVDGLIGRHSRVAARPLMGGEDFSVYLDHVPGCFFWLGSGPAENAEHSFGLHHPKYRIDEDCLPLGSSLMAAIALRRAADGIGK